MQTLLEKLRTDFSLKTLGELIREREAAANEIERLTRQLARYEQRGRSPENAKLQLALRRCREIATPGG